MATRRERRYLRPDQYRKATYGQESAYHQHQFNRSMARYRANANAARKIIKVAGYVKPDSMSVLNYWKHKRKYSSLVMNPRRFNPKFNPHMRAMAHGTNTFVRRYGFQIAAGAVAAEAGYLGIKHIRKRRMARRRTTAGHHYQNQPPQLTKAQRQQMARRRRRVKGRFA